MRGRAKQNSPSSAHPAAVALAILLDTSASMDERMGSRRKPRSASPKLHKDDQAECRLRQPGPHPAGLHNDSAALEQAIRKTAPNGSTSLYNALYMRAQGPEEGQRPKQLRHPPAGHRPAVGWATTSSLIEFDQVLDQAKRSRPSSTRSASARGRDRAARVQGSGVRAEAALERNRRKAFSRPTRASCRRSTSRSGTSSSQYASPTRRATPSATARGAACRCVSSSPA